MTATSESYALPANPALTGNATLAGFQLLTHSTLVSPSYNSVGRFIELGSDTANTAYIDFHPNDSKTTAVNFDVRIYSTGGTTGTQGLENHYFNANSHTFNTCCMTSEHLLAEVPQISASPLSF